MDPRPFPGTASEPDPSAAALLEEADAILPWMVEIRRDLHRHPELGLDEQSDVFEIDDMAAMRDLMELTRIAEPELHDPPFAPVEHPAFVRADRLTGLIWLADANCLSQNPSSIP